MKIFRKLSLFFILVLLLSACGGATPTGDGNDVVANDATSNAVAEDAPAATDEPVADAATEAPAATDAPAATEAPTEETTPTGSVEDCLPTVGNLVQVIQPGYGYCLTIPSGYTIVQDSDTAVHYTGPFREGAPAKRAVIVIMAEPAAGRTTQTLSDASIAEVGMGEVATAIQLGGHDALLQKNMPGMLALTAAHVVVNDLAYTIKMIPLVLDETDSFPVFTDSRSFWVALEQSISFFPQVSGVAPSANLEGCVLDAEFVSDVTIPDEMVMEPGAIELKTWRLRNNGTCDWGIGFEIYQTNESALAADAPGFFPLPAAAPGAIVEVSVLLELAQNAKAGDHYANFAFRTADGETFGGTPYGQITVEKGGSGSGGPTTAGPTPTAVSGLTTTEADCVEPKETDYWYSDGWAGVCVVYDLPADVKVESDTDNRKLVFIMPHNEGCTACDAVDSRLVISRVGKVSVSVQDFANQYIADNWEVSTVPPVLTDATIGGHPAIIAKDLGLPAVFGVQEGYVIANGIGYVIRFEPQDQKPELWDEVLKNIVFFE